MTNQNDVLSIAVHNLADARPDSVRGRIVYVLDDIDDEHLHRVTDSSGLVDADFLCNFVSSVTEHIASIIAGSGMPPHAVAIGLMSAAKAGIDSVLGNNDDGDKAADEDAIQ